jgi:hypothetical protein
VFFTSSSFFGARKTILANFSSYYWGGFSLGCGFMSGTTFIIPPPLVFLNYFLDLNLNLSSLLPTIIWSGGFSLGCGFMSGTTFIIPPL